MRSRNIIIVGVLDNPASSNVWMANSFIRYGFNVIPINYRKIVREYGRLFFENLMIDTVKNFDPYLTIFCKFNGMDPNIISECNKYTRSWLWMPDSYMIAKQHPDIVESAKRTNFSSCQSQTTIDYFKEEGVKNCYHIFEGVEPNIHKPVDFDEKFKADISFIGSKTTTRDYYKKALEDNRYNVKFYGNGYSDRVSVEDWAKICSSSKFMLSLNTFNDIPNYFSGRVFETLACEVCTLHLDTTNTLTAFFEDGKEIIFFNSVIDLFDKINNTNLEAAKEIAINGRKRVLRDYTFDKSVSKIINIVEKVNEI